MNLKLIVALVNDAITDDVTAAARNAGATGATIVTSVRGEGLKPEKTFLGLDLSGQRDLLLFIVAEPLAREILETIQKVGEFDEKPGSGVAIQLSIEDAVGLKSQAPTLIAEIEKEV